MNGSVTQSPTSAWSMYRAIVGIAALCALLVVTVYQATAARIEQNQARFLAQAISEVLPEAASTRAVALSGAGRLHAAPDAGSVFLGYGDNGDLVGAVVSAEGMGYQDNIRVLYAYSLDLDAIVGFKVLESKETPGLGDRIETEPHFLANFRQLDSALDIDGNALLHPIETVKQGEKTAAWQIDGITGATISAEAIGTILNDSANNWVPALERDAPAFSLNAATKEP